MITRWRYCHSAAMITRWHYYIDTVMITKWRYCLNAIMITRWQYCLSVAVISRWHYCICVEMVTGCANWIVNVYNVDSECVSWDKLAADDRAKYLEVSHDLLSRIEIPDAVYCTDVNACDASHINDTNLFYEQTMRSLKYGEYITFNFLYSPFQQQFTNYHVNILQYLTQHVNNCVLT